MLPNRGAAAVAEEFAGQATQNSDHKPWASKTHTRPHADGKQHLRLRQVFHHPRAQQVDTGSHALLG